MNKFLSLFTVLVFVFTSVQNIKASTLVFSAEKDVKYDNAVEIGSFDASRYKQIRITVKTDLTGLTSDITISGGNEKEKVLLHTAEFRGSYTQVIDTPPEKISVYIKSGGKVRLYVWASQ